ncbi:hypothetical protein SASPL_150827 [Salvia splendens]|uniref:Retrotransposon gag domain-containing protein n=1 Tax=Salvia splendens TaxID=180675 RepID=A0A8X8W7K2_SALSN|nr:hypothetical protein SASPL_150827 [Salvia splendens]
MLIGKSTNIIRSVCTKKSLEAELSSASFIRLCTMFPVVWDPLEDMAEGFLKNRDEQTVAAFSWPTDIGLERPKSTPNAASGRREKLDHIEGDQDPPKTTDPEFNKWQASDFTVFTWLIQNMEPKLVLQFAQHQTARALWRSLATTFRVRADLVQVYDLEIRTNQLKQGNESLEQYWGDLQQLWVEIDARRPCPYTCCEKGINTYRKETEIKRLYQFLSGLDDKYDALRRELLKQSPEPSAEDAFGIVKQEETRTGIWKPSPPTPDLEIGAGFGEGGEFFATPMGSQAATSTRGDVGGPAALPSGSGG